MTFPGIDPVAEYHRAMVAMLEQQRNAYATATLAAGPFFGLSVTEYDDMLRDLRDELDKEVVLMMVASAEACIRNDFNQRLSRRTKDAVRRKFKALQKKHGERVRLTDILDAWRREVAPSGSQAFAQFAQLLKHRHWLAHGRYWTDKSGVVSDPVTTRTVIDALFVAFQGVVPTFPLG